jgi:outer membrane protein OmpA-like peptidoglycan-associated protein
MGCEPVRVNFEFDSSTIDDSQKAALDRAAQCLKDHEKLRVFVEGNTDAIGSSEYNRELGGQRSQAVAEYLKAQGVSAAQLQQISLGEGNPLCKGNEKESCRKVNRNTSLRPACNL